MKYVEKFKDPRWQKKRLEVFERDSWTCRSCKATDKTFNAHHLCYIKGYEPWEYDNLLLLTLCQDCHKEFGDNPWMSEYFLITQIKEEASREFKTILTESQ